MLDRPGTCPKEPAPLCVPSVPVVASSLGSWHVAAVAGSGPDPLVCDEVVWSEHHRVHQISPRLAKPESDSTLRGPAESVMGHWRVQHITTEPFETFAVMDGDSAPGKDIKAHGLSSAQV